MKCKKNNEFHYLLLPIIFVLSVLPFITRLILFNSGLGEFPWFSDQDVVSDFFTFYKSYTFIPVSFLSGILLLMHHKTQKDHTKKMGVFLFLAVYLLLALLSVIFSVNLKTSLVGQITHFEGFFVLFGYAVMVLFSYRIKKTEEDYKRIVTCLLISFLLMSGIGISQMFGYNLLESRLAGYLIIPGPYQALYFNNIHNILSDNAVFLTLFNPNFACVYLTMLLSFFSVYALTAKNRKEKAGYSLLLLLLLLLIFKTYSRVGLLSILFLIILSGYFYRSRLKKLWLHGVIFAALSVILFLGIDAANGFRYVTKLSDTLHSFQGSRHKNTLNEILTQKESVLLRYKEKDLHISYADPSQNQFNLIFSDETGKDLTRFYDPVKRTIALKPFNEIQFCLMQDLSSPYILCKVNDILWCFTYDKDNGYQYLNDFGKTDVLTHIPTLGFAGKENIASGRGYIWSRSLPLLSSSLFLGSGPDTFSLVFPQSDYVGKANNCKTPYTFIEKPHNLFLMIGIQTGVLSLIAVFCFYLIYLRQSLHLYGKSDLNNDTARFGLGCFLATITFVLAGLFNDSSIQTTPMFCVLLGLGMDANLKLNLT